MISPTFLLSPFIHSFTHQSISPSLSRPLRSVSLSLSLFLAFSEGCRMVSSRSFQNWKIEFPFGGPRHGSGLMTRAQCGARLRYVWAALCTGVFLHWLVIPGCGNTSRETVYVLFCTRHTILPSLSLFQTLTLSLIPPEQPALTLSLHSALQYTKSVTKNTQTKKKLIYVTAKVFKL